MEVHLVLYSMGICFQNFTWKIHVITIHGERLGLMVAVISFMFMVFFIILMGNNEDVRMIDEDYRRYLANRKKESKKDKFLKEIDKYNEQRKY